MMTRAISIKHDYSVISNCPHCKGALFVCTKLHPALRHLHKCIQCARFFKAGEDGTFTLWARPARTSDVVAIGQRLDKEGFIATDAADIFGKPLGGDN